MLYLVHAALSSALVFALPTPQGEARSRSNAPATQTMPWNAWKSVHPGSWVLRMSPGADAARSLFGGTLIAPFTPQNEVEWEELARIYVNDLQDFFPIPDSTLFLDEVKTLHLQAIGTTNKVAVRFQQQVDGLSVVGGEIMVLMTPLGDLLALENSALTTAHQINLEPVLDSWTAIHRAHQNYQKLERKKAEHIALPQLCILPTEIGKVTEPRLAWELELRTPSAISLPSGRRLWVDAVDGTILKEENLVHRQDLQGHVESWASPGTRPDVNGNPAMTFSMPNLKVESSVGNTTTATDGTFTIPYSGSSAVNVTFDYDGDWCWVDNQAGSDYSLTQSFQPGVYQTASMNPNQTADITAEANAYKCVNEFHQWIKRIDPTDNTMDLRLRANVNISSTCNAYYDGSSINFYKSGNNCANTAYSTVVAHEEGHWANSRYGSGNGADGFGEGNADVFAMYLYDTPLVGENFSGSSYIRSGNNTRQFCGDSNGGCYGSVHADGEVLMGALWKVRQRLNTSLGNQTGDLVADTLFYAWMNGYNDSQIRTSIEEHWLILDDDDGNIGNGTPNYDEIDLGFREQGFPGIDLEFIQFEHIPLEDTQNEVGPYLVSADLTSMMGSTVTSASVHYSVDGGGSQEVMMSLTQGNTWQGEIPGQISPAQVSYYLAAEDQLGNSGDHPRNTEFEFIVGQRVLIYFNDFEGSTDEDWIHAQVNTQDDWQRGTPQGLAGDPSTAYSGNNVWANDLGLPTWNGEYQPNVSNYLRSPEIDCTGFSNVRLRFARWLTVEESRYDQAQIKVNGTQLWENPYTGHTQDSRWDKHEYDISQIADNRADVKVRYNLITDAGLEFGGWTIDDFELYSLMPSSGNSDWMTLAGDTSAVAGGQASWTLSGGPPSNAFWLLWSTTNTGTNILGHDFDIGANWNIGTTGLFDATGMATISTQLPPSASGMTVYLEGAARQWVSGTISDSNLLTLVIQ
ncbi:MAG: hypothetical protein OTJ44_00850 [Planctomycetota bacterium]|nr:hypothetical protein [Planctomycetota bacterium]